MRRTRFLPFGSDTVPSVRDEVRRRVEADEHVAVLARLAAKPQVEWPLLCRPAFTQCVWQRMPPAPADYARELYASLRALDALRVDRILVEAPPGYDQDKRDDADERQR